MRGPTAGVGANLENSGLAPAGELELPEQPSVRRCRAGPCLPPAPLLPLTEASAQGQRN